MPICDIPRSITCSGFRIKPVSPTACVPEGRRCPRSRSRPFLSVLTAGRPAASPLAMLTSDHVRYGDRRCGRRVSTGSCWTRRRSVFCRMPSSSRGLSDGVLFVIAAGITPYALVQRCIAELGADRIVGTVLNRVEPQRFDTQGYYNGYFGRDARTMTTPCPASTASGGARRRAGAATFARPVRRPPMATPIAYVGR